MSPHDAAPADLPFSPAADRNKRPILDALRRLLPPSATVLEIASGTGQHAQHFASACPSWVWQPTDASDTAALRAIDTRCRGLTNVLPALRLDVLKQLWPVERAHYSAVYCANMLHIAPWSTCPALMKGAASHLAAGGLLLLYGPFRIDGMVTAPSNEAFDADLRARHPEWGLRSLADVKREAAARGLALQEAIALPANNLLVSFTSAAE
jgi:SAM-dependent methyltransferase